jgi:hypothetical protein
MRRRFCLVLVKPSHYDDDGYVIQWKRSPIPSNSLAALYGLARDAAKRQVLGPANDIEVHAFDETNTASHALKPLYNFMAELPSIQGSPIPILVAERARRTAGAVTSFDAGRGCPYQCSFCTIINVQGRKSRRRSPDDVEQIIRVNYAQGLRSFFITDDNFARNKDWEAILDRLIHLRESESYKIGFIIQVDTLCHKLPNFVEKCSRAGVRRVFIGLENINPANLAGAKKKQNKITEYRQMLLAWKAARVITYAGYIIGFPNDTVESILNDIDVIKRELPVDLLEFFCLTPLPGSEDHLKLFRAGVSMDDDLNNYDLNHITTAHPKMSADEWKKVYRLAWQRYYTMEHIDTVLRRVASTGANASNALFLITWFKGAIDLENVHPLESGFFRTKFRTDRRPGLPIEAAWTFYPRLRLLYLRIRRAMPAKRPEVLRKLAYSDLAMTPVRESEHETHELFGTAAARAYVNQERHLREVLRNVTGSVTPGSAAAS